MSRTSTGRWLAQRNVRIAILALIAALVASLGYAGPGERAAGAAGPIGVYSGDEVFAGPGSSDPNSVELGLRFQVGEAGSITAVRFYKTSANTGAHTGSLWTLSGTLLARVTFADETATGWQTATLSSPIAVSPGTTYVVSYHTSVGHYAQRLGVFDDDATIGNSSIWGTAGVYRYGASTGFPVSTWQDSAYYVDALFAPASGGGSTTSPTASPTRSSTPTTSSSPTPPAGAAVGMYDGDETGQEVSDPRSVELGVRFRVAQDGFISGIRYYKTAGNTGAHTGALWSPTGSQIASVTFANETASGWQTAAVNPPVAVSPGQTYVASYHTSVGKYAEDVGAFDDGATIGDSMIWGTAGVYRYGTTAEYPNSTWENAAYFVDALFTPGSAGSPTTTPSSPSPTPTRSTSTPSSSTPTPSRTPTSPAPTSTSGKTAPNTSLPPHAGTLKRIPQDLTPGPGWHYDSRGWIDIDGAGTVFSGYQVTVSVNVMVDNVTVANNDLTIGTNGWGVVLRHAENVKIIGNKIHGPSGSQPCDNAIRDIYGDSDNVTISANEIYWCNSGINHFNAGGLIQGNVIRDIGDTDGCAGQGADCGHWNGIQLGAGSGPLMVIDSNTILVPAQATDAIMLANDDGSQTNRTITNNLLGGGGYAFYGSGGPDGRATNIIFTGNRFTTRYFPNSGYYGPVAHWQGSQSGNVWANNTWADGPRAGQQVSPS